MIQPIKPLVDRELSNLELNSLMRSELAAVETYRSVIANLDGDAPVDLHRCLSSHDLRAVRLAEHITLAGGTPVTGKGKWDVYTRSMSAGEGRAGPFMLLNTLVYGEQHALDKYRAALDRVDNAGVTLVRNDLLPEQVRTYGIVSMLCRRQPGEPYVPRS